MKSGGRPVKVTFKGWNGKETTVEEKAGVFHCWGYRKPKEKDNRAKVATIETVAIVELVTGVVKVIKPENVVFLDGGING